MSQQRRRKASSSSVKRAASCEGKQKLTRDIAIKVCSHSEHKIMPYRCRFCGWWHVGLTTGKAKDDRRRKDDREN